MAALLLVDEEACSERAKALALEREWNQLLDDHPALAGVLGLRPMPQYGPLPPVKK